MESERRNFGVCLLNG
jgi:hypothetical protein